MTLMTTINLFQVTSLLMVSIIGYTIEPPYSPALSTQWTKWGRGQLYYCKTGFDSDRNVIHQNKNEKTTPIYVITGDW